MVTVFSVVWILFGKKCDTKKKKRQREREVPERDATEGQNSAYR
jgi:hypothetical protein